MKTHLTHFNTGSNEIVNEKINSYKNYEKDGSFKYGHVRRRKDGHALRRMVDAPVPGKRRRGRPKTRWKDLCKRDMG